MRSWALIVLFCMAPLCSGAEEPLYIVVLQPVKAGAAPFDVAKFSGMLEHRNGLRLAVRLPEGAVEGVKSDPRVRYVQKVVVGSVERANRPIRDNRQIALQADVAAESVGTIVRGPYTYDGTGNISSIGSTSTPDERFTYDRMGRLSTAKVYSQAVLYQQSFAYDAPGNLTNVTTDGVSVALPVQGNTNRLATSAGFTYDATGNMTASPMSTSYSYDQLGMLKSDASTPCTNVYTASDERLAVIRTSASPSWRWTLRDLSNQRVRDFESFGPTGTQYFLWLEDSYHDGSRVIASQRDPAEGGWRHFHLDHLGTPRLTTNEDGRQISRHDYLAYGIEVTSLRQERNRGFAREQVSRFTGHERDYLELTNADDHSVYLDYMHARTYNPNWARFLSVDPTWDSADVSKPQSWNRYAYVRNDPVNLTDPDGREPNVWQAGTLDQFMEIVRQLESENPKATPGEILDAASAYIGMHADDPGNMRYVYTTEGGWIDQKHFFRAADEAVTRGEMETNILGIGVEVLTQFGTTSFFSYEDLPSNRAGADFGDDHFYPDGSPLSSQAGRYLRALGATDPENAPNYLILPKKIDQGGSGSGGAGQSGTDAKNAKPCTGEGPTPCPP